MIPNAKSGCLLLLSGISLTAVLIGIALYMAEKEYYGIVTLLVAVPVFVLSYRYGNRAERQEENDRLIEERSRAEELIAFAKQGDFELAVNGASVGLLLLGLIVSIICGLIFFSGINQSGSGSSFDIDLIVIGFMFGLAGLIITFGAVIRFVYPVIVVSTEGIKAPFRDFVPWERMSHISHFDYKIRTSRIKGVEYCLRNKKTIRVPIKKSAESSETVYLVSKYLWVTKTGLVDDWDSRLTEEENLTMRETNRLIMKGLDKEAMENPDSPEVKLLEKAHKIISLKKSK